VIVLDASALIDVVLDQPYKDWVLDSMQDEAVCAPCHQPVEVLSALARLHRAGEITAESARAALLEAVDLEEELVQPSRLHLERALELQDRIRVLDGIYVALADERKCALVTTDRRLARAQPPCELRSPPDIR
jgi:predicted nucleic acid-binding protein